MGASVVPCSHDRGTVGEAVQAAAQALFDNHMLAKLGVPFRGRKTS